MSHEFYKAIRITRMVDKTASTSLSVWVNHLIHWIYIKEIRPRLRRINWIIVVTHHSRVLSNIDVGFQRFQGKYAITLFFTDVLEISQLSNSPQVIKPSKTMKFWMSMNRDLKLLLSFLKFLRIILAFSSATGRASYVPTTVEALLVGTLSSIFHLAWAMSWLVVDEIILHPCVFSLLILQIRNNVLKDYET